MQCRYTCQEDLVSIEAGGRGTGPVVCMGCAHPAKFVAAVAQALEVDESRAEVILISQGPAMIEVKCHQAAELDTWTFGDRLRADNTSDRRAGNPCPACQAIHRSDVFDVVGVLDRQE